jgi:dTDP-4-amino-4,6-dideoxygalactose transaminase
MRKKTIFFLTPYIRKSIMYLYYIANRKVDFMSFTHIKNIAFSPPDIGRKEIKRVVKTMKSGWITTGFETKCFEQMIAEYIGVPKAVCLNSGSAALKLTLRILGVGPGDEVITTAYTYTASASVVHHLGAKIVLLDVAPESYELDYSKLEEAITERTKVIIPVDIAGIMCDYDAVYEAVENKKHLFRPSNDIQKLFGRIIVLADAAHALGAVRKGVKCGQAADFTCFSFHAVKNLTTAEGGCVVWRSHAGLDDEHLYRQFMLYSLHGQSKDALAKSKKGDWEYDIIYPAYKCNMTDIMASIGIAQMERYPKLLDKRKKLLMTYADELKGSRAHMIAHWGDDFESSKHLCLVRIDGIDEEKRNNIILQMAQKGIPCNVHYKPLPMHTAYKAMGFDIKDYLNSYRQYQNEITLPLHTLLSKEDVVFIARTLKGLL